LDRTLRAKASILMAAQQNEKSGCESLEIDVPAA